MHRYEITIFWSNEDDAFIADIPELPGCKAHGDSQKEALENAADRWRYASYDIALGRF